MKRVLSFLGVFVTCATLAAACAFAEETYKKFRFSLAVGNYSTTDQLESNADNVSFFNGPAGGGITIEDPRPDSAVRNPNQIKDDFIYEVSMSYGLMKWKWGELTLDSGVGYFKGTLGDLEFAGQYDLDPPNQMGGETTRYHLTYIPIGEVTEIPVQFGGTFRFRPKKTLNPYIGAGIGYIFAEIESSAQFDEFSRNVGLSTGAYTIPTGGGGSVRLPTRNLRAAQVDAPDTFEYHLHGGMEFTFHPGWSAFVSGAWMWAKEEIDITIDGRHSFGSAIPNGTTNFQYPVQGLPVIVQTNGLFDFGRFPAYCQRPNGTLKLCPPDGVPDTGAFFAQGGKLRYSGFKFSLGMRYQF